MQLGLIGNIIAYVFLSVGLISIACGVLGLFRFKVIYMRLLVSSNIDAVGMLLMMLGAIVASGDLAYVFKIIIVLGLSLVTSPLSTHAIARSAYDSGYRIK